MIPPLMMPPALAHLTPPAPAAATLHQALMAHIAHHIDVAGGWISFSRYMALALYAPGLGYYAAGARKLGEDGDFITAPELSPLFAQCLARQLTELHEQGLRNVLELGAGSGALAAALLPALHDAGCAPDAYCILEVSADLRERQAERLRQLPDDLGRHVRWLDALPDAFEGVVIANEVLDATPVHRFQVGADGVEELGVSWMASTSPDVAGRFVMAAGPAPATLRSAVEALQLAPGYSSEINLGARALVTSLAQALRRGIMLFIDYGFPAREYYHPQRSQGTLMCHYRHHAHGDPLVLTGLQDITTHVDFSAMAQAALAGDAGLLGYTSQAQFLINCGITELLAAVPASDAARYAPRVAAAQKLLSPAEMGELFKVIAFGRGFSAPLMGFARGDRSHTL